LPASLSNIASKFFPLAGWKSVKKSKLGLVLLAAHLLSVAYFGFIASSVYTSHASLIVRTGEGAGSNMNAILSGATGNGAEFGGYVFQDFALSWDEFDRLRVPLDLGAQYSAGDFVSRFGGLWRLFATDDIALWKYYRDRIDVSVDTKSGIVSLIVSGYDPGFAQELAESLLTDAVTRLTNMNIQRETQMMRSARERINALSDQLAKQDASLADYRSQIGIHEPDDVYQARLNLLNTLAVRQTELSAQYAAALRETPNSPTVSDLKLALDATRERIALEEHRVAETSRQAADFDKLKVRRDNAVELLRQANVALHEAQRDAVNNGYFLNVISQPSRPGAPELPYRLRWISGIFVLSLLAWGILR
jgi:capsular polysaccharide transport system permease protein